MRIQSQPPTPQKPPSNSTPDPQKPNDPDDSPKDSFATVATRVAANTLLSGVEFAAYGLASGGNIGRGMIFGASVEGATGFLDGWQGQSTQEKVGSAALHGAFGAGVGALKGYAFTTLGNAMGGGVFGGLAAGATIGLASSLVDELF